MRPWTVLGLAALAAVALAAWDEDPPHPLTFVNEYIGTGSAAWGIGHNNPAAQFPFAPLRLGPDTAQDMVHIPWNHFGGYYYRDGHIRAFSHTHVVGAGLPDYGNFGVMPLSVAAPTNDTITRYGYRSTFSHESEKIFPGFYTVYLDVPQARAELTVAGEWAGAHRYTFTAGRPKALLLDVCHHVKSDPSGVCMLPSISITQNPDGTVEFTAFLRNHGSLTGRNGRGVDIWLYGRFRGNSTLQLSGAGTWKDGVVSPGVLSASTGADSLGGYFYFGEATAEDNVVEMTVGLSFLSAANARANHDAQLGQRSFDQIKADTTEVWRQRITSVVSDLRGSEADVIKYYTSVYRTLMSPTIYSETDGRYLGMDEAIHTVPAGQLYYSDMSLWDTYRTQHPWLVIAQPAVAADLARSLTTMYLEGGSMPRWPIANVYTGCMFGDNANMVLLDTYIKGIVDFNFTAAYHGMRDAGLVRQPRDDRGGLEAYIQYGYIPIETSHDGVCASLAYYYNDWAIARAAEIIGEDDMVTLFDARAQGYRNLWDSEALFMCNRYATGEFKCPQTDIPYNDGYVEGNQWHYFLDVPHDLEGLISLFPSVQSFVDKLEYDLQASTETIPAFNLNYFPNPYYWQGNEHNLLFPWLFNAAGRADRTQYWTRWILANRYTAGPEGLPGNDDYGTMSAWYTFGAIGLYPLTGADYYFVGSPNVDRAVLNLCGRTITFLAIDNSAENVYVSSVTLNGAAIDTPFVTHEQLCGSALPLTIVFAMSATPV